MVVLRFFLVPAPFSSYLLLCVLFISVLYVINIYDHTWHVRHSSRWIGVPGCFTVLKWLFDNWLKGESEFVFKLEEKPRPPRTGEGEEGDPKGPEGVRNLVTNLHVRLTCTRILSI